MRSGLLLFLSVLLCSGQWLKQPANMTLAAASPSLADGPLDLVPTNQVLGVSFYYALSKNYTNDLFRLREGGGNNETNIYSIISGQYRIMDTNGVMSWCGTNIGYIVRGTDQTGNGKHMTNATASRQPMIYNGSAIIRGATGIPAARFDGVDDALFWKGTLNQPDTFLHVMQHPLWVIAKPITDGGTPFHVVQMSNPGSANDVRIFAGAGLGNIQVAPDTVTVLTAVFNGSSSVLQKDTGTPLTGNAGTAAAAGATWAGYGNGSAFAGLDGFELTVWSFAPPTNTYGLLIKSALDRY